MASAPIKGLTMRQIIKLTPRLRRDNSAFVKISELKVSTDKTKTNIVYKAKTQSSHDSKGYRKAVPSIMSYVTTLQVLNKKGWVKVSCSCDDFWATWEVALHKYGAADIEYSNGEKPVERNPRMVPGTCIAKDSLVHTERGTKRIQDVKVHDKVWTLNGLRPVTASSLTRAQTKTLKFTLANGRTLECTPDHKLYVVTPKSALPEWKEAQSVSTQDHVVTCSPESTRLRREHLVDEALLTGYLVSEEGEYGYAPMERATVKEYSHAYANVTGEKPTLTSDHVLHKDSVSKDVWKTVGLKPTHSKDKVLPENVLEETFEFRMSLLYALFQGDGWISDSRNAATFGTSSKKLAIQIQELLDSLGYSARITENVSGVQSTQMYLVRLTSEAARRLTEEMPLPTKYGSRSNYFVDGVESTDLKRIPLNLRALKQHLKKMAVSQAIERDAKDLRQVIVRSLQSQGFSVDKLMANLKNAGVQFGKVKTPNAAKPSRTVTQAELTRVMWTTKMLRPNLQFLDVEWGLTSKKLLRFLKNSPEPLLQKEFKMLKRLAKPNVGFEKVTSIVESVSDVYDLTVQGTHHFTANGVVVHNCKHSVALGLRLIQKGRI